MTNMSLPTYQLFRVLIICYFYSNFHTAKCESSNNNDTFLYFAYGSNLLAERIRHSNPTAEFHDIGVLENYRLDFEVYAPRWGGAGATIVPTVNSCVWGAIWKISNINLETLDRQEKVDTGLYFGLDVDVKNIHGRIDRCRVYRQTKIIEQPVPLSELPEDRRPSLIYLNTIISGARQSNLPKDYIDSLLLIKHNGHDTPSDEVAEMRL